MTMVFGQRNTLLGGGAGAYYAVRPSLECKRVVGGQDNVGQRTDSGHSFTTDARVGASRGAVSLDILVLIDDVAG